MIQTSIFRYSKNYGSLTHETRIKDAVNMGDLICLLATVRTLKELKTCSFHITVGCAHKSYKKKWDFFNFCQYLHIGAGILSFGGDVFRLQIKETFSLDIMLNCIYS